MLQFDPRRRITVEQALQHPYLADMHDEASEMSAPGECPINNISLSKYAFQLLVCSDTRSQAIGQP